MKKASESADILSGSKYRQAHIDLCPPNSDVIKYAPEWACAVVFRQLIHLLADVSNRHMSRWEQHL